MDTKVRLFLSEILLSSESHYWYPRKYTLIRNLLDILEYILPIIPPLLLSAQNNSGSTPLHWATLNEQLGVMKTLIAHPAGPKGKLVSIKNNAGRTPLGEAEMAGWDEGAAWLVRVMDLDDEANTGSGAAEGATDEAVEDDDAEGGDEPLEIHVEVQDAEGGISRMTINSDGKPVPSESSPSSKTESSPTIPPS